MGLGGDLDTRRNEKMQEGLDFVHIHITQHRADFHFLKLEYKCRMGTFESNPEKARRVY